MGRRPSAFENLSVQESFDEQCPEEPAVAVRRDP
jgi:hypothetical protein